MIEENTSTSTETIENQHKKKSVFKSILSTVSAGVVGSLITLAVVPYVDVYDEGEKEIKAFEQNDQGTDTVSNNKVSSTSVSSNSIADMVEQVSPSIVGISNYQKMNSSQFPGSFRQNNQSQNKEIESGTGSGVIYHVTDDALYIVTNNHVIEDADKLLVTLYNKETVEAELIGSDALTDLAVLKVNGKYDITPIRFGDSDSLRAGEEVIAIGNPLGLDFYGTVTQGIISAVNRSVEVSTTSGTWEMDVIQTDAAINPGNSGGALLNTSGQLIGINSMKISNDQVEGLGFAIPSNEVKSVIEELMENGKIIRPYLGISMVNLSDVPSFYLQNNAGDVMEGIIITDIDPTSSAAKAGLQENDIILSINGKKMTSANDLRKYLYKECEVGDEVTIEYYRNGKNEKVNVILSAINH